MPNNTTVEEITELFSEIKNDSSKYLETVELAAVCRWLSIAQERVLDKLTSLESTIREENTKSNFTYFIAMLTDVAQNPGKDHMISIRAVIDVAMEAEKILLSQGKETNE